MKLQNLVKAWFGRTRATFYLTEVPEASSLQCATYEEMTQSFALPLSYLCMCCLCLAQVTAVAVTRGHVFAVLVGTVM